METEEDLTDKLQNQGEASERFAESISGAPCKNHGGNGGGDPTPGTGGYDCNIFDGAKQCDGFARKVFFDIWDGQRMSGLEKIWNSQDIRIGDYVRIKGNTHSAFVIGVGENDFTVIECNLDGDGPHHNCLIRHNEKYQKSSITYIVRAKDYTTD